MARGKIWNVLLNKDFYFQNKSNISDVQYMKNMQIIANNIAIPWENRFAAEHVIYFVTIEQNKQNIELLYTNKKLPVAPVKLTLIKKIRLRLNSTILGAVYMRGVTGRLPGPGNLYNPDWELFTWSRFAGTRCEAG
jgi:hypothetical protein